MIEFAPEILVDFGKIAFQERKGTEATETPIEVAQDFGIVSFGIGEDDSSNRETLDDQGGDDD